MEKIFCYNLDVSLYETLPVLPPMHDYEIGEMSVENDKVTFTTEDFLSHDDDYADMAGFKPKKLSIECRDLCDETFFVNVTRFYPKNQFQEKHKNDLGSRTNIYQLKNFAKFYKEYRLQFNYFSVSYREVILFFSCNNPKKKAQEVSIQISCQKIVYTFSY